MVKRKVVWTETASQQRRYILEYWTEHNGSTVYAEKLIELIRQRIDSIQKFPESSKMAD